MSRPPEQVSKSWATRAGCLARRYFASGWAFLLPYLIAYLAYAFAHGPVQTTSSDPAWHIPGLVDVFRFMHVAHLALLVLARWGVSQPSRREMAGALVAREEYPKENFAFWICLVFLFLVPGVYLEYPADPWEHFSRINSWVSTPQVMANPNWTKASYFFAYTLIGFVHSLSLRLRLLDCYYTGSSLLLCWQYFRLARSAGASPREARWFVLLQVLLLGNNVFGFYRYYGISSTLFAQLGAIAAVRVVLESVPIWARIQWRARVQTTVALASLALLIAFQHVQGFGIAALGIIAVLLWRAAATGWKALAWSLSGLAAGNLAVLLFWPHLSELRTALGSDRWLTPWYGYNLFATDSPAFYYAAAVIGGFGALNLVGGILLLRRNQVTGWLTLVPLAGLACPLLAVPFSLTLLDHGQPALLFQRLLLAIPTGFGLIELARCVHRWTAHLFSSAFALAVGGLFALVMVPNTRPTFNRLFNTFMRPPSDLATIPRDDSGTIDAPASRMNAPAGKYPGIESTSRIKFVRQAIGIPDVHSAARRIWFDAAQGAESLNSTLRSNDGSTTTILADSNTLFSAYSQSAFLSAHWPAQAIALDLAGTAEIAATARLTLGPVVHRNGESVYPRLVTLGVEYAIYGKVALEAGPEGPESCLGFPDHTDAAFVQLRARVRDGSIFIRLAGTGGSRESDLAAQGETTLWPVPAGDPARVALRFTPSSRLELSTLRLMAPDGPTGPSPAIRSPITLIHNLSIHGAEIPGGLFAFLNMQPAREYVLSLSGEYRGPPPSLRLDDGSAHGAALYLAVPNGMMRLRLSTPEHLRLLIYREEGLDYNIRSLEIRPAIAGTDDDRVPLSVIQSDSRP
ncbi:MAG TPA: hypothetical protein VHD32_05525 [Candidatus Didemnitutus sp.]|nr:hypothetical protein [Candidatus Didemnitutus sp.]